MPTKQIWSPIMVGRYVKYIQGLVSRHFSPTTTKSDALRSIGGFSNGEKFYRHEEETTERELRHLLQLWNPLLHKWNQLHLDLDLEDTRKV